MPVPESGYRHLLCWDPSESEVAADESALAGTMLRPQSRPSRCYERSLRPCLTHSHRGPSA
jgi:hypothetical protein